MTDQSSFLCVQRADPQSDYFSIILELPYSWRINKVARLAQEVQCMRKRGFFFCLDCLGNYFLFGFARHLFTSQTFFKEGREFASPSYSRKCNCATSGPDQCHNSTRSIPVVHTVNLKLAFNFRTSEFATSALYINS